MSIGFENICSFLCKTVEMWREMWYNKNKYISTEGSVIMTEKDQKNAAKKFADYWKDKGD